MDRHRSAPSDPLPEMHHRQASQAGHGGRRARLVSQVSGIVRVAGIVRVRRSLRYLGGPRGVVTRGGGLSHGASVRRGWRRRPGVYLPPVDNSQRYPQAASLA